MPYQHWTEVEEEFMRILYPRLPAPFLARLFERPIVRIHDKGRRMGLHRGPADRPWNDNEDALVRTLYPTKSAGAIARALGRSRAAIKNRVNHLGLRKTDNPGRFPAGHTAWNKGMKGLDIGGKATRFQPGQKPHTWRPIGTTRENGDGYLERKIADTRCTRRDYVPIHQLVFRDGNRRNFDINNLELITRRELMARNTVHTLPPELAKLVQLRGALNRQINRRSKAHA